MPGSAKDRRALHYMAMYGISSITGFAPDDYLASLLTRCRDEASIRNAFVALGHCHLEFCLESTSAAEEWRPSILSSLLRLCDEELAATPELAAA